jgi:hypothetical protein
MGLTGHSEVKKEPKRHDGRFAADIEGDFVVFLIGFRMNKWWKIHRWFTIAFGIWPMLRRLREDPGSGLLAYELIYCRGFAIVQYWRSFEQLARYSRDRSDGHHKMWVWYNTHVNKSGDIGIWHETYHVQAGHYEGVYGNMPRMGLARAGKLVPMAEKGQSAAKRIGFSQKDEVGFPYYE